MTALCECGCGQVAPLAKGNFPKRGVVKGQQLRFVHGHNARLRTKQPCEVEDCDLKAHAHGYCSVHAGRQARHGTPTPTTARLDPVGAFWLQVERAGPDECWLWNGFRQPEGYGRISPRRGPSASGTQLAHRVAYELAFGLIPEGLHLDHLCRNPPCVNPAHLEPVTAAENTLRGLHGVLRVECAKGHPLTPENTYLRKSDNSRHCKTCRREQSAERRQRGESSESLSMRTHCKKGHELAGDNIKWNGSVRQCRTCARESARKYAAKKRAQSTARAEIALINAGVGT